MAKKKLKTTDRATLYALAVVSGKTLAGPLVRASCQRHLDDLKHAGKRGFYYNEQEASEAIAFFEEILFLNGGQYEGKPFILFPWESFIIGSIFGWKRKIDDMRRFRVAYVETAKGPLALDTPIATTDGWTTMKEIKPGDVVFNSQGNPTVVTAISPIFTERKCYRLKFSDGAEIVADAEHEWLTFAHRSGMKPGPRKPGEIKKEAYGIRTTERIKNSLKMRPSTSYHPQAKWNHRVDVAPKLDLPDVDLPLPPYALGAWLGDGNTDDARLTVAYSDWQIVDEVKSEGIPVMERANQSETTARVVFGGDRSVSNKLTFQGKLRAEGLLGNKHIPLIYLRSGTCQRLSLLQGLMDTDGHISPNGKCEITLCNQRLCNDVADLIRSLGYKCTMRESAAMLNGKEVGRRWRINFQAYRSLPPVRLLRKVANLQDEPNTRALSRGRMIVACDPVESVPVRCITVASDDHMFLAGNNLVPTCNSGKSPLCAGVGIKGLVADNESRAEIYAAATFRDQAMVLFRDACAFYDQSPELQERLVPSGVGSMRWNLAYLEKGSFFRVISSEKKGQSGPRPHMALLDEIHEHTDGTVIEMLRAGFKWRTQPLSFMITNPLALDTPIPTPSGWSTMGELMVGDQIFNEEGEPCCVTDVSKVMTGSQCYKIIFDDGSEIIADSNHLWETTIKHPFTSREAHSESMWADKPLIKRLRQRGEENTLIKCHCGCGKELYLYDSAGRSRSYISGHNNTKIQKTQVRTTIEIKDTLQYGNKCSNHEVRLASPLQLPEAKLPIPPYTFGCWMGDGSSKESSIVVADQDLEILENISSEGVTIGRRREVKTKNGGLALYGLGVTGRYRSDSLHSTLRREGLLRNKHIPDIYLRASAQQRLSLLQGLMDTDGSIVPWSGKCIFTQSRICLASQVAELINSLGMKCNLSHSISKLNGKSFDRWDVHFWPPWDLDVFRLNRKKQYHYIRHSRKRSSGSRWIREIVPVDSVPVKCITVDANSHLYLAGKSMIPTHNSGYDKTSVCWEYHTMGEKVSTGAIQNDEFFAYICALDEGDVIDDKYLEDESSWVKVNPSLEYGLPGYDYIRGQINEARGMPSKMATVKRLSFCQWTDAENPWISSEVWMPCRDSEFDYSRLADRRCWGGLDLSAVNDLTSFALMFEPEVQPNIEMQENGKRRILPFTPEEIQQYIQEGKDPYFRLVVWFWMPGEGLRQKSDIDHVPYDVWHKQGHIFTSKGKAISKGQVIRFIYNETAKYDLIGIAYDRNRMKDLIEFAENEGIELAIGEWDKKKRIWNFDKSSGIKMMPFGQEARSMAPAIDKFETMLLEKQFRHNGNPCLTSCAANVVVDSDDAGYRKMSKRKSIGRIDGIVASVMACGILEDIQTRSAYDGLTAEQIKERMAF